jgi:hypothetical protein
VGRFDGSVLASFLTAPAAAFGLSGHVGARWPSVSLSLGGHLAFSLSDGIDTARVSAWRMLGEAMSCLHWDAGFVGFGCGVVQAGVMSVRAQTPDDVRTHYAPSASAGVRLGVQIARPQFFPSRLAPFVSLDLTGAVWRSDIWVGEQSQPPFEWWASPFTMAIGLGVVSLP